MLALQPSSVFIFEPKAFYIEETIILNRNTENKIDVVRMIPFHEKENSSLLFLNLMINIKPSKGVQIKGYMETPF